MRLVNITIAYRLCVTKPPTRTLTHRNLNRLEASRRIRVLTHVRLANNEMEVFDSTDALRVFSGRAMILRTVTWSSRFGCVSVSLAA